ncbi:MAG: CO dehydrogenase/CO-methylating acetyl-CoA synthase complex subunit beta [Candidatus Bathyarchaeota archaeon]|nr:CO dehydrogenase/CO-methylating acetyl-CoA synthase complex subunit beta [Candidatus Bathyarchaeota archaeon]MDH5532369.1 CO dehydrogenase/CO-methylating acetyl-CoA synthase complex subunit beta [Candidatus Bathyarchaeota archaeon]MDH5712336.1 CO dehydrogenase/CO-methylating acetyl-CoA synthase complex subunit beta [Candidatus Bathyarchaeota archaeon]
MFEDIPVDVGVIYEGERVRRNDMYVELGGPKQEHKFELVKAKGLDEIEDEKIIVIGPDIKDMEEGSTHPLGIYVEVAGKDVEEDLEGVIERRIHEYSNYIEGFMHLNQRYDIWLRLNKKSFQKGLNSFDIIGKVLLRLFKSELPFIEKIQITFITDPEKVREMWKETMEIYEARDAKARGMKDEEADAFYGCTLCQSFAPTHCCVITPQRYANCGAISWFDGRASARVDPKGPIFSIDKGECIDPFKGEYTGANAVLKEKTLGEVTQVWLYTAFDYPHTSCGCFEGIAFYIPEVDGLGIVHRAFDGTTVNGLPFSTMADSTAGGRQVDGFHGVSIEYMRSPKFLQVDDGWSRVVWMPSTIKERVKDFIPEEVVDKIATENDVKTVDELKVFLEEKEHPVVERWKAIPAEAVPEMKRKEAPMPTPVSVATVATMPVSVGGFKIILKDAKIHAKKVIIRAAEEEK